MSDEIAGALNGTSFVLHSRGLLRAAEVVGSDSRATRQSGLLEFTGKWVIELRFWI